MLQTPENQTTNQQPKPFVKNVLKPWTKEVMRKSWEWCTPMLDTVSLYHLYKCMGKSCCFTTDDTSAMTVHLLEHEDTDGILTCAYCVSISARITDLIYHIKHNHGQCKYQCKFCFYRALDAANVLNHQQMYHSDDGKLVKSILELPHHPEVVRGHYMNSALGTKVRQKILKCTVCHEQYLAISSYIQHVQMAHQGSIIDCCWCLKTIRKMNLASHLLTHYIGTYECLYCDFACNIKLMMLRHLCNVHGSKPLYCSKRREGMNLKDPHRKYHLDLRSFVSSNCIEQLKPNMKGAPTSANNFKQNVKFPTTLERSNNEPSMKKISVPKIANVQGGIQLSQDGVIVAAKVSVPSTVSKSTKGEESAVVSVKRPATGFDSLPVGKRIKLTQAEIGSLKMKFFTNGDGLLNNTGKPIASAANTINHSVEATKCTPDVSYNKPVMKPAVTISTCKTTNMNTNKVVPDFNTSSQVSSVEPSGFSNNTIDNGGNHVTFMSEPAVKHIGYHFLEFPDIIDDYYKSLTIVASKKQITSLHINVCGFKGCEERFGTFEKLKYHMKIMHRIPTLETVVPITCSHCDLSLVSINAYISHLTVHNLNRYVCFLCCYIHFLPTRVVKHMSDEHACHSIQLSYVHPKKLDLLCDLIAIMPGKIGRDEKRKYILKTIAMAPVKRPIDKDLADKLTPRPKPIQLPSTPNICPVKKACSVRNMKYPKEVHYSLLYKCGLCLNLVSSKLSFQKHLTECSRKQSSYYFCAYCDRMFKDWLTVPDALFQHLYFHGENLYGCGECSYYHYLFESVATHIKKRHRSQNCEIKVLRETSEQWECNVCQLRTPLRQIIMEHMQNMHDLPGERFMCSLCKFRTFTNTESVKHFKESHQDQNVVMIEIFLHYKSLHMHSRIVHGSQSKNYLLTESTGQNQTGSFTGFRLHSLARCFYCEKHDTHLALRIHCEKKHASKPFICLDYWNTFKCGMCAYRNGSGNEKEFSSHFQHFHNNNGSNGFPFDHIDDTFVDWALSIGKKASAEVNAEAKVIKYICGLCPEQTVDELDMGMHVAIHALTFKCPHCKIVFRHLKVLYEHALTIHRDDALVVPSSCPMSYDQPLLEVKLCFVNGFILSKREAQFTSHGSLQILENGFQKYYEKQMADLEEYKISLLTPVSTSSEVTPDAT
uniref:C2H2-type domain-containing protein n=1 Tax=Anopheles dirus TaxID=7168 RepID=A0A182NDE2_9DIPT